LVVGSTSYPLWMAIVSLRISSLTRWRIADCGNLDTSRTPVFIRRGPAKQRKR
jgi:hypothetical protein